MLTSSSLCGVRRQTLNHWLCNLVGGFGWSGVFLMNALATRSSANECSFDYAQQALICSMELPGTLLVQPAVDSSRCHVVLTRNQEQARCSSRWSSTRLAAPSACLAAAAACRS